MIRENETTNIFNDLTFNIIKTLEKRKGVCDIKVSKKAGASMNQLLSWEKTWSAMLGDDLKNFYLTANGLTLTWSVQITAEAKIPVGRLEVNSVEGLTKLGGGSTDKNTPQLLEATESDEEQDPDTGKPRFDQKCRIFELDSCDGFGKVCYVYKNTRPGIPAQRAEVWFLDRALRWHFLSDSFLGYFRLMLTHLGLPQWLYAFTDIGIPPQAQASDLYVVGVFSQEVSKDHVVGSVDFAMTCTFRPQQWFSLYCPVRLQLDEGVVRVAAGSDQVSASQLNCDRVFKGKTDKRKASVSQPLKRKPKVTSNKSAINTSAPRASSQQSASKPAR